MGVYSVFHIRAASFNTQPPEGGWFHVVASSTPGICFNTQPPEGGWDCVKRRAAFYGGFNTQPPEGGWAGHPAAGGAAEQFQHTAA